MYSPTQSKTLSFHAILTDLRRLQEFLASLDLIVESGRIAAHVRSIDELERSRRVGDLDHIDDNQTLWSLLEAVELVEIFEQLGDYSPSVLAKKFKLILKGPGTPDAEDSASNLARNTAFELSLAAKLRRTGVFRDLLENPDILCEADGLKFLIQCKRPLEEKGIARNIERATEQLRRDLRAPEYVGAHGVIAISLSRILHAKFDLLVETPSAVVREVIRSKVDDIANDHDWIVPNDPNIIGTVFDVSVPVFTIDEERPHGRFGSVHIQCIYRHRQVPSHMKMLRTLFDQSK